MLSIVEGLAARLGRSAPTSHCYCHVRQGERVVLGLTTCPQCDVLKAFLEERKLTYSFVKWDKADPESHGRACRVARKANPIRRDLYFQPLREVVRVCLCLHSLRAQGTRRCGSSLWQ